MIRQKIDKKFEYNIISDSSWLRSCEDNVGHVGVGDIKVYLKEAGSAYRGAKGNKDS